jgi:hypothetical protein
MAKTSATAVRVRAYNVRFGDCILVSFKNGGADKHILIDFGNAPGGVRNDGGINDVFEPVARDLAAVTGKRIDLLIMSHEHLDHMEGFYSQRAVFDEFDIGQVWMSAMSAPDYYTRFPHCKQELRARLALHATALRWDREGRFDRLPAPMQSLIANNVLALANKDRINYIRSLVPKKRIKYLSRRTAAVAVPSLGPGVTLEVLAPERDASAYYGDGGTHFWFDATARFGGAPDVRKRRTTPTAPKAPSHIASDEFAQLRDEIAELDLADLLAIDKAANNTSLVFRLTVHGKKLLFPGDAEGESWAIMKKKHLLGPVDLVKLAHHGSINGMPFQGAADVLGTILKPGKKTVALACTCSGVYGDTLDTKIPHHELMTLLEQRCKKVHVTEHGAAFGQGFNIML